MLVLQNLAVLGGALALAFLAHGDFLPKKTPLFSYWEIDGAAHGRVAIGDVDGDSNNDIVVHSHGSGIKWYQSSAWTSYTIVPQGVEGGDDIELADIDRDGDLDLVAPWAEKAHLYWFENPGAERVMISASWRYHRIGGGEKGLKDVAVIDLDGDGNIDVVSRRHDQIFLHFQDDQGSWTERRLQVIEREGMDVGDLDGDGDPDILLNGFWLEQPEDPKRQQWRRHNIDPLWYEMGRDKRYWIEKIFSKSAKPSWRDNGVKALIKDLDQDGKLDVIFSASERTEPYWPVAWYRARDPKGGPAAWTKHVIGQLPNAHSLQAADFDGDGDLDVIACRLRDGERLPLYIFYNRYGARQWDREEVYEGGCYSGQVGDIDNDGDMDFVSSRTWKSSPVYLLRNQLDLSSAYVLGDIRRHKIDDLPDRATFVQAGDLDGDGFKDLVAGAYWWRNPGTIGGIWQRGEIGAPLRNAFAIYDFDRDGNLDILGTQGKGSTPNHAFAWARNQGKGVFEIRTNIETGGAGDFLQGRSIGDFGRGLEVILSWHNGGGGVQSLRVPVNPVSTYWTFQQLSEVTQEEDLSKGDIDKDGSLDLLLGTVWLRNDGGSWTPVTLGIIDRGGPDRNDLADIDGDGDLDAVIGLERGTEVYWFEAPSDPTGQWKRHLISHVAGEAYSMDVADIDHDGDVDVIVGEHRGSQENRVLVFLNREHGAQWVPRILDTGDSSFIDHHDGTQAMDMDNDSDLDIVSIGWNNRKLWIYENMSAKRIH